MKLYVPSYLLIDFKLLLRFLWSFVGVMFLWSISIRQIKKFDF